jgi:hypothetical protein
MKPLHYFSPTSFMEWKHCAAKFVTKRLMGYPKRESEQGKPAAAGCAFDCFIKRWLATRIDLQDRPDLSMEALVAQITREEDRESILDAGRSLAIKYVELGFGNRLLDEGLYDLETDIFHLMDGPEGYPELRLFGKLDSVLKPKGELAYCDNWDVFVPHDWKIRGYGSKQGYSPTPGYSTYLTWDGKVKSAHKKAIMPIDELHGRWGIQLTMYAWMLNNVRVPDRDLPIAIDEITYGNESIVFSQIRTYTSLEYQQRLYAELLDAWKKVHEIKGRPMAEPNSYKCNQFNMLCEVAVHCPEYEQMLNHPLGVIR